MIKIIKDNSWYCACCDNQSNYKIDFYEDYLEPQRESGLEEILLCNKHLEELKSKLMK